METKVIDQKSYKIHTIKTDRYKTSKILISFRGEANEDNYINKIFLSGLFNEGTKKYPTARSLTVALEEIYSPNYGIYTRRFGDCMALNFSLKFINPEFIQEEDYLKNIISFLFESILKPNVSNCEFDNDNFNLVKKNILLDIDSIDENGERKAMTDAVSTAFKDTSTSLNLVKLKDKVKNITSKGLYESYLDIMNNDLIDIYIIGNTNMDNITNLIKNEYKNHHIRSKNLNYYVENKINKSIKKITKKDQFMQSNLICLYNLINLTLNEKEVTFNVMNYLLGNGGLSSKLYKYIREQNSYCYSIDSIYFKHDNVMAICASLDLENIDHTVKLINKSILELQKGIFTDEELENAKQNLLSSLKMNQNYPDFILNNYINNTYLGNYDIETKIKKLMEVNKKDIMLLSKKIKPNMIYVMQEEK